MLSSTAFLDPPLEITLRIDIDIFRCKEQRAHVLIELFLSSEVPLEMYAT